MSGTEEKTTEKKEQIIEIPEVKLFGIGEGGEYESEKKPIRRGLFMFVLFVAVMCIAVGIFKAWDAFREFDSTIMEEKDRQFYSLISSEDINIDNALNSFCRESDTFFEGKRLDDLGIIFPGLGIHHY